MQDYCSVGCHQSHPDVTTKYNVKRNSDNILCVASNSHGGKLAAYLQLVSLLLYNLLQNCIKGQLVQITNHMTASKCNS
ncbi:MAG: hypothetical protein ACKPKO_60425 [Candidatus Fonsibacter sp.]